MSYGVYPQKKGGSGPSTSAIIDCKYLVGNVPNGDSAAPYAANGFFYFPDPGDGSGIAAALSAAAVSAGDVHIRPGIYDFGAGAVPTPLTIPGGIVVSGAGVFATTLIARQSGDQGVFVIDRGAKLSDVRITAGDAGNTGVGSSALIAINQSAVRIENVSMEFAANALSTLRCAISVSMVNSTPIPVCDIQNVSAFCDTSLLPNSTPTIGLRIFEGQVHASNVQMVGFDYGYHIDYNGGPGSALLFGDTLYAAQFAQYGFYVTQAVDRSNVCALRVHNSITFAKNGVPPLGASTNAGFQFNGGFANTVSSCVLLGAYYGVNVTPDPGQTANVQVDDSTIALTTVGVQFGEGSTDGSVTGCDIGDEFGGVQITSNIGVFVNAYGRVGAKGIVVEGNSIKVANYNPAISNCCGVLLSGVNRAFVSDNDIKQARGGAYTAIFCEQVTDTSIANNAVEVNGDIGGILIDSDSDRVSVTGNQILCVSVNALFGILAQCSRVTITGNVIDHFLSTSLTATITIQKDRCTVTGNTIKPSPTGTAPAIRIEGSQNTCSNNVVSLDNPPAAAGVELGALSTNNVVLGNVCLTTPPVNNLGVSNEVAHNI